jgi:integration host factor subunit alpha
MFRPSENVSDYPETSLFKRRFYYLCADFTSEPTVSNTITEELSLNEREAKEIVKLYYEDVLAILNNDDQIKLSGFGKFYLLHISQRAGRDPIIRATLSLNLRRTFARVSNQKHKSRILLAPDHNA